MANGSNGEGREGKNSVRNLDAALKANAAKARANKAKQGEKRSADWLPF